MASMIPKATPEKLSQSTSRAVVGAAKATSVSGTRKSMSLYVPTTRMFGYDGGSSVNERSGSDPSLTLTMFHAHNHWTERTGVGEAVWRAAGGVGRGRTSYQLVNQRSSTTRMASRRQSQSIEETYIKPIVEMRLKHKQKAV